MGFSFSYSPPEYLQITHTGLVYFRYRIPSDLKVVFGKSELKYSLKTRNIRTARQYLASILPFVHELTHSLRGDSSEQPTSVTLKQIIDKQIHDIRMSLHPPVIHYTNLVNQSPQNAPKQPTIDSKSQAKQSHQDTAITPVTALQESFFNEKKLSQEWRPKTKEDHEQVFKLFVEIIGDIPVESIDKPMMRRFKDTVASLPPNMRKDKRYRNKSIKQILRMKPEKTISTHTINKYLSRLSNLFNYGVSHGFISANPANGLKVKLKGRPDEERQAYSSDDLRKLFGSSEYSRRSFKHSYQYWVPLIGLYTGCRLEEICQLHLEDISKTDSVWIFDINESKEKSLKNLSSTRVIPVHPKLVELGLLKHIELLRQQGENRLFPELRKRRDGYSQDVSRWYQRFKQKFGFDSSKNFHSFRHTFITHLKHKQIDPFMIHELDGHTIQSETMGRYGKRFTPKILLKEAIEKIDYGIDLIRI
ncbi:tyrosine-type recombinase/integrase [Desulforhopalus sp. 52FAK]